MPLPKAGWGDELCTCSGHRERCLVHCDLLFLAQNDVWLTGVCQSQVNDTRECPGLRLVPDTELQLLDSCGLHLPG